ncbi:ATP-binding protein [Streptomyces sp. WAC 04229]|uniref:ATP-binding protein n=1 Tax=Streptomyces sp. WAC 04229 TaxID=2203206 RepID=UPI0021ADF6CB|nr:ATP-binding protein [Streptomyces sp. WAC 04229]
MTAFELGLLATPKAVPELRHLLRPYGYDVRLCASELLTNVLDHVGEGTPVTVRVTVTGGGHTRVEVTDPGTRALPVRLRPTADTDESGRGLALIEALALRWGVEHDRGHKTVWCELAGETPPSTVQEPSVPARSSR